MRRISLTILLNLSVWFISSGDASAELKWEKTELSQKSGLQSDPLVYSFSGKNEGKNPVVIRQVLSNCPCVKILSFSKVIAPNESAEVIAVFEPADLGGKQQQILRVVFDGVKQQQFLFMKAALPTVVEITPRHLFWKKGGDGAAQEVTLRLNSDLKAVIKEVFVMDENFSSVLTNGKEVFTVKITPRNLSIDRPAMLMVRVKIKDRVVNALVPLAVGEKDLFGLRRSFPRKSNLPQTPNLKELPKNISNQSKTKKTEPVKVPDLIPSKKSTPSPKSK